MEIFNFNRFMNENEKEVYALLGLLSVRFAKMEFNITKILTELVKADDDLIVMTLIASNNIAKNIDMLKKINQIRDFETATLDEQIKLINNIKSDRNLFIHGIWHEPRFTKSKREIICEEKKIRYSKTSKGQEWSYNKIHLFSIETLSNRIKDIDIILASQNMILKKLENITIF